MKSLRNIIPDEVYSEQLTNCDIENVEDFIERRMIGLTSAKSPSIIHTLGAPGSGKSTWAKNKMANEDNRLYLSCDDVMEELPAYQKDVIKLGAKSAFKKWELPARAIAYELFFRAVEKRFNIIFDHSGSRSEHIELLRTLKESGYHISIVNIEIDENTALNRAAQRSRHLPPHYIPERQKIITALIPEYRTVANTFANINTSPSPKLVSN